MTNFYDYYLRKYPLSKQDFKNLTDNNQLSIDDIISTIYNISTKYFAISTIYREDIIKPFITNYIFYSFIIKSIYFFTSTKNITINKSQFVRDYMIPDSISKRDKHYFDASFATSYRYLNCYLHDIGMKKIMDFQVPYLGYNFKVLRSNNTDEVEIFKASYSKDYGRYSLHNLQDFFYSLREHVNTSSEEYKNISIYNGEASYQYSTIMTIIDLVKQQCTLKSAQYYNILSDLVLIFDFADINLRLKAAELYFSSNKLDFIKDTIYINTVIFKMIDYYVDFTIDSLPCKNIELIIIDCKHKFKNNSIINSYKKRDITSEDEEIFSHLSHFLTSYYEKNTVKDLIKFQYEYEKYDFNHSKPLFHKYNEDIIELKQLRLRNNFKNEINFLSKLHTYNKETLT